MVDSILAETDTNHDRRISFEEFIPFYRRVAEKIYLEQQGAGLVYTTSATAPRALRSSGVILASPPRAPPPTPQRAGGATPSRSSASPSSTSPRVIVSSPRGVSGENLGLAERMHKSHSSLLQFLAQEVVLREEVNSAANSVREASLHVAATIQTTVSPIYVCTSRACDAASTRESCSA
jgi:hypothetical protein